MADADGHPYDALRSVDEAQGHPVGVVVFEGDYGGQIYLVAPARKILCAEQDLAALLADIDAVEWHEPAGARVLFECHPVGATVSGGMDGGRVEATVWVHPELSVPRESILEVLSGARPRI